MLEASFDVCICCVCIFAGPSWSSRQKWYPWIPRTAREPRSSWSPRHLPVMSQHQRRCKSSLCSASTHCPWAVLSCGHPQPLLWSSRLGSCVGDDSQRWLKSGWGGREAWLSLSLFQSSTNHQEGKLTQLWQAICNWKAPALRRNFRHNIVNSSTLLTSKSHYFIKKAWGEIGDILFHVNHRIALIVFVLNNT